MASAGRIILLDYCPELPRAGASVDAVPETVRLLRKGREPMPTTICLKCTKRGRHGVRRGTGPHSPHYQGDQLVDCDGDPIAPGET